MMTAQKNHMARLQNIDQEVANAKAFADEYSRIYSIEPSFDHYIMIQGGISDMKRMIIVVSAIAAIAAIAITTISVPDRFE